MHSRSLLAIPWRTASACMVHSLTHMHACIRDAWMKACMHAYMYTSHACLHSGPWLNDLMDGGGGTKIEKDGRTFHVIYKMGKLVQAQPQAPASTNGAAGRSSPSSIRSARSEAVGSGGVRSKGFQHVVDQGFRANNEVVEQEVEAGPAGWLAEQWEEFNYTVLGCGGRYVGLCMACLQACMYACMYTWLYVCMPCTHACMHAGNPSADACIVACVQLQREAQLCVLRGRRDRVIRGAVGSCGGPNVWPETKPPRSVVARRQAAAAEGLRDDESGGWCGAAGAYE